MEENKLYNKGFNHGYILRKFNQNHFEGLFGGITTESKYLEGFREGGKEAALEIKRNRLNELNKLRSRGDDFELER